MVPDRTRSPSSCPDGLSLATERALARRCHRLPLSLSGSPPPPRSAILPRPPPPHTHLRSHRHAPVHLQLSRRAALHLPAATTNPAKRLELSVEAGDESQDLVVEIPPTTDGGHDGDEVLLSTTTRRLRCKATDLRAGGDPVATSFPASSSSAEASRRSASAPSSSTGDDFQGHLIAQMTLF